LELWPTAEAVSSLVRRRPSRAVHRFETRASCDLQSIVQESSAVVPRRPSRSTRFGTFL